LIYETAVNVEKKIILNDGTVVSLKALTRIEISGDYNKSERIVRMYTGEACFDVKHEPRKPFRVKLGSTDIQDIGTTFTVRKGEKVINVSVSEGKVVFERIGTKESREITAGASIEYDVQKASFGALKFSDASKMDKEQWMNFSNTPLSQVISSIQKEYGKKVVLTSTNIENKKLTARLNGMSFNTALLVICRSLSLEYVMHDSVYILKEKK
jgi:transmembrane sensor